MFRRDYLLRQIEEFVAVILKMTGLTNSGQWEAASNIARAQFRALAGEDVTKLLEMSDTELIARLAEGDVGYGIEEKIFMLARLFKENGDILKGQERVEESRVSYIKGLHLLLEVVDPTVPRPEFVPSIDEFLVALHGSPLDLQTNAVLMRHYEQGCEYARAEDALFNMLDAEPDNVEILEFGIGFYERLLRLGDETLELGNLPRKEVNAGLDELKGRKSRL